jgi:hypothetical protein
MLIKADAWARCHALKFTPNKFKVIYFTNLKAPKDPPVFFGPREQFNPDTKYLGDDTNLVRYPSTTIMIQPVKSAQYLGIYLDKQLTFKIHR